MSPPFFIYKSRNWIYGLDIRNERERKGSTNEISYTG